MCKIPTPRQKKHPIVLASWDMLLSLFSTEADANMPGPQTHTKVSTWHFWHICKGPTDNQLMWESKSHGRELFKSLRSAEVQQQKPRAGSMRDDVEKSPREPPATSSHTFPAQDRGIWDSTAHLAEHSFSWSLFFYSSDLK